MADQTPEKPEILFTPQPGRQTDFVSSRADITIYGGAKGGGKTYGLLLEAMRWFNDDGINGMILRRYQEQLNKPGSIWLEAIKMYSYLGMKPNLTHKKFNFQRHSSIKFDSCQYDHNVENYQGTQADWVFFDELGQFTAYQFWYIVGSLRTTTGKVKPYVRATCNPKIGWLAEFLSWWIDPKTHYPIEERAGKIRWMIQIDDDTHWCDTEKEADHYIATLKRNDVAKRSVEFIPATVNDNPKLLENDPNYFATLSLLPANERLNLMYGRWFFDSAGKLFKAEWFNHFEIVPRDMDVVLITCDTASSTKTANDYTVFQVWGRSNSRIYLLHQLRGKFQAMEQLDLLLNLIHTYPVDYVSVERASTGFFLLDELKKRTSVLLLEMVRNKDKYARAYEVQQYVENGYVYINPKLDYYGDFIMEVSAFAPENKYKNVHDDQVDTLLDAIWHLLANKELFAPQKDDKLWQAISTQNSYSTFNQRNKYG